eukprot:TRINITY_DN2126_c0_g1_i4.p1 TRINITY_DN2126_c0_g1~~TRINITY_DN2126_c0_g1_i4.p1  ORF type:complete len:180 (-),score=27.42 TRINITY_DN2126_c0_g1_i4:773-1312(-)
MLYHDLTSHRYFLPKCGVTPCILQCLPPFKGVTEIIMAFTVDPTPLIVLLSCSPARLTAGDYSNAMHYNRPKLPFWHPPVLLCSARKGLGIDKMWEQVEKFCAALHEHGEFDRRRRIQGRYWMLKQLERQLAERALEDPGVQALASKMEGELAKGVLGPRMAAERLVDRFVLSIRSKKA